MKMVIPLADSNMFFYFHFFLFLNLSWTVVQTLGGYAEEKLNSYSYERCLLYTSTRATKRGNDLKLGNRQTKKRSN